MIWIETLSRHKEAVARVRVADAPVTIGRAYDNEAIVDDPHVAPRHIRILRGDDGALVAEDLGSQNGLLDETGRRQQTLRLDGHTLFRIGQTWMRIREDSFEVAAERILVPVKRLWPWLLIVFALAASVILWNEWRTDSLLSHSKTAFLYAQPLLSLALVGSFWIVFWAVLTRLLVGHARAMLHAIIALSGFVILSVADPFLGWLSFALSSRLIADYAFVFPWILVAIFLFAHLHAVSARHVMRKVVVVSVFALCVCLMQWMGKAPFSSDESSDSGLYLNDLYPPSWRLAAPRAEEDFFQEIQEIKTKVDELRSKSPEGEEDEF